MLRVCILQFKGSQDEHLSLMKFSYNNKYHSNIEMTPFETLYERCCRMLVCWEEVDERKLYKPELVQAAMENIKVIKEYLKTYHDKQKSYADNCRKSLKFKVEDKVFLKLFPWKEVIRLRRKGKLSLRCIGPYGFQEGVRPVAYKMRLTTKLSLC